MTRSTTQSQEPARIDAPWLKEPSLRAVFAALAAGGCVARVVGGAVRNTLAGLPVVDIDIATPCEPNAVARLARAAGLDCYATGLSHGTVTVVSSGTPYHVTTLRRDVETDGRHAVVAFTKDWSQDAQRRDLTINALYCDGDGTIFDPVGGLRDLADGRVRFIGDAATRIREDYLRILRFFRFSAEYAQGPFDSEGLAACAHLKDGLARLSSERIWAELKRLLVAPRAAEAAQLMQEQGILAQLLGCTTNAEILTRLSRIENALAIAPDPVTRLASLAVLDGHSAVRLAQRLRLSRSEDEALERSVRTHPGFDPSHPEAALRAAIYTTGKGAFAAAQRLAWARSTATTDDEGWQRRATVAASWSPPAMPFSGADIVALGIPAGPKVGAILKAFEAWWIGADFPSDRGIIEARLGALVAEAKAAR